MNRNDKHQAHRGITWAQPLLHFFCQTSALRGVGTPNTSAFTMRGTFPDSEPYVYPSLQRDGVEIMRLGLAGYSTIMNRGN